MIMILIWACVCLRVKHCMRISSCLPAGWLAGWGRKGTTEELRIWWNSKGVTRIKSNLWVEKKRERQGGRRRDEDANKEGSWWDDPNVWLMDVNSNEKFLFTQICPEILFTSSYTGSRTKWISSGGGTEKPELFFRHHVPYPLFFFLHPLTHSPSVVYWFGLCVLWMVLRGWGRVRDIWLYTAPSMAY